MGNINARIKYKIIGSDYSAQEPRMTTYLSGDRTMYEAYTSGKDLYAMIAQSAFDNNYEDNLEFYPEGTEIEIDGKKVICGKKTHLNKAGKERRSVGKVLNLAATYGMGGATAGARLNKSKEEGEKLLNNFFNKFTGVKTAIDQSKEFLKKNGYVEDFVGRRRRLSDINLDPYTTELVFKVDNFNPILICKDHIDKKSPDLIWKQILDCYVLLSNAYHLVRSDKFPDYQVNKEMFNSSFDNLQKIAINPKVMLDKASTAKYTRATNREKLLKDLQVAQGIISNYEYLDTNKNITIKIPENEKFRKLISDYISKYGRFVPKSIPEVPVKLAAWTGKIAQAERQCFNARIQGSAATLTKMAMVDIFRDEELKECQADLIITVHDEVLVECPAFYADRVEKRLPEVMVNAAKKAGDDVPQACDPYNVTRWYADTAAATLMDEFKKLENKGVSRENAFNKVIENHPEFPKEAISKTLETGADLDF